MQELQAFDPLAWQKRIAETVQQQFGMLIPAEAFDTMVAKEIHAYFEEEKQLIIREEPVAQTWGSSKTARTYASMTPFRRRVWEAIDAMVGVNLDATLSGETFKALVATTYSDNGERTHADLSAMLERKLEELAPKIMAEMFRGMFGQAVVRAKQEVLNELRGAR